MKASGRVVCLVVLALVACSCASTAPSPRAKSSQAPPLDTLFIGNSYTFFNDMPGMLEELARASGRDLHQQSVVAGGATLEMHWNGGAGPAVDAIAARPWRYVVLQERGRQPIEDRAAFDRFARLLTAKIAERKATALFFLPWPQQSEPQQQPELTYAITTLADELRAEIAPVGPAWAAVLRQKADAGLYASDGRHPTPAGSYLTALVFFAKLFSVSPEGLPARLVRRDKVLVDLETSPQLVRILQRTAWETVTKSPPSLSAPASRYGSASSFR